jgi:hypothetical protein
MHSSCKSRRALLLMTIGLGVGVATLASCASSGGGAGSDAGQGGDRAGAGGGAGGATAASGGRGGAAAGLGGAGGGGGVGGAGGGGAAAGGVTGNPCAARAGLKFCDDFEAAPVAGLPTAHGWSSTIIGGPGTVVVDGTVAHSGARSVRVHPGADDFDTFLVFHDTTILPAPGGKFFLRLFMRLAQAMTPMHNTFFVADMFANPGSGNAVRMGEDIGMLMMTISGDAHGYLSNQNYYNDGLPGVVFTPAVWTCVEVSFDPALTTMDVWVDGQEIPDMHPTNIAQDSYDELRIGFEKYAGPASDIWYDDVAIGSERIGCN